MNAAPSRSPITIRSSGLVYGGRCIFHGYMVGTDGVNDPTVTIRDSVLSSGGNEVVPAATYDASLQGMNGATGLRVLCENGLYVDVSCAGSVKVVLYFAPAEVPIALQ